MTTSIRVGTTTVDLGGTVEFLTALRDVYEVTGEEYPTLYGLVTRIDGEVTRAQAARVRLEAGEALRLGGDRLRSHTAWLLSQLSRLPSS